MGSPVCVLRKYRAYEIRYELRLKQGLTKAIPIGSIFLILLAIPCSCRELARFVFRLFNDY